MLKENQGADRTFILVGAKKILLVEDNNQLRGLMSMLLRDAGYDVTEVSEGSETMVWAHEAEFDVILLDIMMPLLDGLTVLRYIRNTRNNCKTPVVIVSARARDMDIEKGYELGADAYVTKPFDPEELLATVHQLTQDPAP